MTTTGIDVLVNIAPVVTSAFRWDLSVNFSNPNSEVTELAEGVENVGLGGFTEPAVYAIAGDSYRSVYGLQYLKDPTSGKIIIDDRSEMDDPNVWGPGVYGYPVQDNEVGKVGDIQADFNMGINNSFSFKGLSVSVLIDIKKGGQMWNGTIGALYYFATHKDTENREDAYVHDGLLGHYDADGELVHYDADGVTELPGAGAANTVAKPDDEYYRFWNGIGSGFTGPSEPYVEDADWVRLRELTVAYNFGSMLKGVSWLKNVEVYFSGRNLWISTPYTGIDPETSLLGASNAQGFDYFNMPGTKAYSFGLRLGF
jgi:hypothetical protein